MKPTVQETEPAELAEAEKAVAPHAGRPAPTSVGSAAHPPSSSTMATAPARFKAVSPALGVSQGAAGKRLVRRGGSSLVSVERDRDPSSQPMTTNGRRLRERRSPSSGIGSKGQRLVGRDGKPPTTKDGLIAVWCENDGTSVPLTVLDALIYVCQNWDRLFWPFKPRQTLTLEHIESVVSNACSPSGGESHVWRRESPAASGRDTDGLASYRLVSGTTAHPCVPLNDIPKFVDMKNFKKRSVDVPRGPPSTVGRSHATGNRVFSPPRLDSIAEDRARARGNFKLQLGIPGLIAGGVDVARASVPVSPVPLSETRRPPSFPFSSFSPAPPTALECPRAARSEEDEHAEAKQVLLHHKKEGVNRRVTLGLSARGLSQSVAAFLIGYDSSDRETVDQFWSQQSALAVKFRREGLIGCVLIGSGDSTLEADSVGEEEPGHLDFSSFRDIFDSALADSSLPKRTLCEGIALKHFHTRCRMAEK